MNAGTARVFVQSTPCRARRAGHQQAKALRHMIDLNNSIYTK